jgi:hypothetical protein
LPDFVVLNGGLIPSGGVDCFGSGFLPASHQGSIFKQRKEPVANIRPLESRPELQRSKLDLLKSLDAEAQNRLGPVDALESAIANYEMAFRMQAAVPGLTDLSNESAATRNLYGLDAEYEPTRIFAHQCLLARRLVERGVRFVQVWHGAGQPWDTHDDVDVNMRNLAGQCDRAIGSLLIDLKERGLLDETLVICGGEFGRTPSVELPKQGANQGKMNGRDHNHWGFSTWLAGGGVRGGYIYGATDEFGYKAVENRVHVHDLHATILKLMGFDHTKFTYRYAGRDFRLTDVHGQVVEELIA